MTVKLTVRWLMRLMTILWACTAQAQVGAVPAHVPVHGYLTDDLGVAMDGELTLVFNLYTQAEDAAPDEPESPFHTEQQLVKVDQGQFTAFLGDGAPLDLEAFAAQPEGSVFLGVKVGDDPEMRPRLRLGTAPFAAFANTCGDAATLGGQAPTDFAAAAHGHAYPATFSDTADPTSISSGPVILFETSVTCPEAGRVIALGTASARWEGASAPGKCSLNIREQGDTASSFRQTDILFEADALSNTSIPIMHNRVFTCSAGASVNLVLWGLAGLGPCSFFAPTLTAFFTPG